MKLEMTLLAIAAATVATLAGSAFAAPDSAHGAGRARAPGANNGEVLVLVTKGSCDAAARGTITATPARVSGDSAPVQNVKSARGAGRARAPSPNDAGARALVPKGACEKVASGIDTVTPGNVARPTNGRSSGRARATSITKYLAAWWG
ncbi:hypothetical protein [Aromatoleum diolicum]|uniref:Uncharacterized protein n=1 Tax=Aromatoleum diolicum TaxID=75796 RepID=A0ABX1QEC9_9RHOO|nr:hypothetical protein [Aromatoleum diolicum]NMG75386.1 hypothetical protein [Aromatoleum diolicum]